MSAPSTLQLVEVGLYLMPALLWTAVAQVAWQIVRRYRLRPLFRMLGIQTTTIAAYYCLGVVVALMPDDGDMFNGIVCALRDAFLVAGLATLLHVIALAQPAAASGPSRRWLAVHYGVAAVVTAIATAPQYLSAVLAEQGVPVARLVLYGYDVVVPGLCVAQMARRVRRGGWRAGGLGDLYHPDLVIAVGGLLLIAVMILALAIHGRLTSGDAGLHGVLFDVGLGFALVVPFFARLMNEAIPRVITGAGMLAAAGVVYLGVPALGVRLPAFRPLLDLAAVVLLVIALGPGRLWLLKAIYRLVFHRSRRRHEEMQVLLRSLAPEEGVVECCRRAVAEVARAMQLRGAAILLADGTVVVAGDLRVEPLVQAWPRGAAADALPSHAFGTPHFWDLAPPLQAALEEADIVGVVPVISPRRRWGYLFATAGHLAAIYGDEDIRTNEAFAAQLALVLDAADLLVRAVAVERALAHAEKLAAIGETAARIAHEIRNPVTAARSLAQQLARDPASPLNAEHAALILTELERVERQVAALLRFARREDFRFAPVDLGELVTATVATARPRLEEAQVALEVDARQTMVARADREKLRQVLLNLIENAVDALGEIPTPRRLRLAVTGTNGTATVSVSDNGPGVSPAALPQLFEPFFSLKEKGTGLGLAIARRTVEAHGGRIEAEAAAGAGLTIRVTLPAAGVA